MREAGWGKTGRLERERGIDKPSIYENVIRESVVLYTNFKINKGQLNGSAGKRACGTGPMAGFDPQDHSEVREQAPKAVV